MVSFGFYGKPVTIELSDFEVLRHLGFNEDRLIDKEYHNNFYVLPSNQDTYYQTNELRVINVCRFLNVDEIYETGVNSVFNINLKMDIILKKGDVVIGFQAKSSYANCLKYLSKYENRKLNPYYSSFYKRRDNAELEVLSTTHFDAPGVTYLSIKGEGYSFVQYLASLSKWLQIPVKKEYIDLITLLRTTGKSYSIDTLRRILRTDNKEIVNRVAQLKTIYPIQWDNQYVSLRRQRQRETNRS